MQTLYITHPSCRLHDTGSWHPECPERLDAINDQLMASGVLPLLSEQQAGEASEADLLRVHTAEHLQYLESHVPDSGRFQIDPDTHMNPHTLLAAHYAAGAGIVAVDSVMAEQ